MIFDVFGVLGEKPQSRIGFEIEGLSWEADGAMGVDSDAGGAFMLLLAIEGGRDPRMQARARAPGSKAMPMRQRAKALLVPKSLAKAKGKAKPKRLSFPNAPWRGEG